MGLFKLGLERGQECARTEGGRHLRPWQSQKPKGSTGRVCVCTQDAGTPQHSDPTILGDEGELRPLESPPKAPKCLGLNRRVARVFCPGLMRTDVQFNGAWRTSGEGKTGESRQVGSLRS